MTLMPSPRRAKVYAFILAAILLLGYWSQGQGRTEDTISCRAGARGLSMNQEICSDH